MQQRPAVIVIGDLMCDTYLIGNVHKMSQEAPQQVPLVSVVDRQHYVGGAGNLALSLLAVGCEPVLVTRYGALDEASGLVHQRLTGKLSLRYTVMDDTPLSIKTRVVDVPGRLLARYDIDYMTEMSKYNQELVIKNLEELLSLRQLHAFVVSDYNKGFLSSFMRKKLDTLAKQHNVKLFVDCKPAQISDYAGASLLKINFQAAMEATSGNVHPALALPDYFEQATAGAVCLRQTYGYATVVVTMEHLGAVIVGEGFQSHVPATAVSNVVSVVGAGDTFMAALVASFQMEGMRPDFAVHLANKSAGLAVQRPHTCCLTENDWRYVVNNPGA